MYSSHLFQHCQLLRQTIKSLKDLSGYFADKAKIVRANGFHCWTLKLILYDWIALTAQCASTIIHFFINRGNGQFRASWNRMDRARSLQHREPFLEIPGVSSVAAGFEDAIARSTDDHLLCHRGTARGNIGTVLWRLQGKGLCSPGQGRYGCDETVGSEQRADGFQIVKLETFIHVYSLYTNIIHRWSGHQKQQWNF